MRYLLIAGFGVLSHIFLGAGCAPATLTPREWTEELLEHQLETMATRSDMDKACRVETGARYAESFTCHITLRSDSVFILQTYRVLTDTHIKNPDGTEQKAFILRRQQPFWHDFFGKKEVDVIATCPRGLSPAEGSLGGTIPIIECEKH